MSGDPRHAISDELAELRALVARVEVLLTRLQGVAGTDQTIEQWHGHVEEELRKPRLCAVCKTKTGEE